MVLARGSELPLSIRAIALMATIALSAKSCWVQPRRALAALICLAVIMQITIASSSKFASNRVFIDATRCIFDLIAEVTRLPEFPSQKMHFPKSRARGMPKMLI